MISSVHTFELQFQGGHTFFLISDICGFEVSHFRPENDHTHSHDHPSPEVQDLQWFTEVGPDGVPREVQMTRAEIDRRLRDLQSKGITDTRYYGSSGLLVPDRPPNVGQLRPGEVIPGSELDPWAVAEETRRQELERLRLEKLEQERRIKELEKKLANDKEKTKPRRLGNSMRRNNRRRKPFKRPNTRRNLGLWKEVPVKAPPPQENNNKRPGLLRRLINNGRKNLNRFMDNIQNKTPRRRGLIVLG